MDDLKKYAKDMGFGEEEFTNRKKRKVGEQTKALFNMTENQTMLRAKLYENTKNRLSNMTPLEV